VIVGSIAPLKKDAGLLFAGLTGACGRGTQAPLSFEWRGKSLLSMPSPKVDGQFTGAVAVGPDNYWAVGAKTTDHWATNLPLLAHWTGTKWQLVNAPSVPGSATLNGIAVDATGTLLAVGRRQPTCVNCYAPGRTLAIQGKNGAWQKIGTPNPFVTSTSEDAFVAVAALPGTAKFWAVGTAGQGTPQAWAARYSH
jgi:hypothetical protein